MRARKPPLLGCAVSRNQASAAGATRMKMTYLPIDRLKLDPKNPRLHSPRQIRQIVRSIKAFGFNVPVLVNAGLKVIAGHGRILACRELGWTVVPTIRLEHLTEAQARAFMIADNRLTENSVWDDRLLGEQLKELSVLDLDFDLTLTGFDTAEIDLRIEGLQAGVGGAKDAADKLPPDTTRPPVSRAGDLWLLGRHRLLCGSALDPGAYELVMEDERASVVFTDPPYNVKIDGHASGLGAVRHRDFQMASGEMDTAAFTDFLSRSCLLLTRHSINGSIHFICMDWRHVGELLAAGGELYSELKNIAVWVKHNAGMGSFYRSQHEFVFVFKHGRSSHKNNVQLGRYGRHRSNVWSYRGINDFGRGTDEGNLLALHPTIKPVALVADAILDASSRGEIVLDPFLGSGTTLIAAERTGRRCHGIEIDPVYVDTIIRRWQAFTGDTARHVATGQAFNEERGAKCTRNSEPNTASGTASRRPTVVSRKASRAMGKAVRRNQSRS
jgi:DNA modification methylase